MGFLQPACSGIDQLKKILRLTGTPDSSLVERMQSKDVSLGPVCMADQNIAPFMCSLTHFQVSMDNDTTSLRPSFLYFSSCFGLKCNLP